VYFYRISGVSVSSDIELPGLFPAPLGACDVAIRRGPVPRTLDDAVAAGPIWAMTSDTFLLRVPGIGRFLINEGHTLVYEAEPGEARGDIVVFLMGTAFGILLRQRGLAVLHASSVRVNGAAMLFLGPSGAGKSTLAAALGQRGYPLLTDDFCVVSLDAGGTPLMHPDGRLHKLWAQAISRLDLDRRRGNAVRGHLEKFYVEPAHATISDAPLPVGPVYVLREARATLPPGIQRPNIVDAALLLRQNAFRARVARKMGQHGLYLQIAAAISNRAGVFQLTREMDFAALPEVIAGLERHWAGSEAGVAA
jgi:hypothetical protein